MWTFATKFTSIGPSSRLHTAMIDGVHTYMSVAVEFSGKAHVLQPSVPRALRHSRSCGWRAAYTRQFMSSSSMPPAASQAEGGLVAAAVPDCLQRLPPRIRGAAVHLLQRQVRRHHRRPHVLQFSATLTITPAHNYVFPATECPMCWCSKAHTRGTNAQLVATVCWP